MHEILPPWSKRFRPFPPRTVTLAFGAPVNLDDLAGREQTTEVLDEATRRLMAAIETSLAGLRGESRPDPRPDARSEPGQ